MSRNKIAYNKILFDSLDSFVHAQSGHIRTYGQDRFIAASGNSGEIIEKSNVDSKLELLNGKAVLVIKFNTENYFICVGYDDFDIVSGFIECPDSNGFFLLAINELKIEPTADKDKIRNVVDVGSKQDGPSYVGHDIKQIETIYPSVRVLKSNGTYEDGKWFSILNISLSEVEQKKSWMSHDLMDALRAFGGLEFDSVPFDVICRSIFDASPGSLFLALYKCLEGLYSYKNSLKIKNEFGLNHDWKTIAEKLEKSLGWRPNEKESLIQLLSDCTDSDHNKVLNGLNLKLPDDTKLSSYVAKRLYDLRNNLVHFRPATNFDIITSSIDWNALCIALTGYIFHLYE